MNTIGQASKGSSSVLLFLAEGFEDLEAAAVLDVCGWTQYREHIPTVRVTSTGFHQEVHGRFGLVIKPDVLLPQVEPAAYCALALPGGFHSAGFDEVYDQRLYRLIRRIHAQGGTIASFCVGVLPVAEAGLLKGKRATSYPHSRHHDNLGRLRRLGAIVVEDPVVLDERIISCAGPAQSIDVALLLLESIIGLDCGREVRRYMTCQSGLGQGEKGPA